MAPIQCQRPTYSSSGTSSTVLQKRPHMQIVTLNDPLFILFIKGVTSNLVVLDTITVPP